MPYFFIKSFDVAFFTLFGIADIHYTCIMFLDLSDILLSF